MPKNNEKKNWSEMTDEEKKVEDERLNQEQGESKQTGWEEKFKERQELIKETAEAIKPQEPKIETTDEREKELTKQREELGGVYESKAQKTPEDAEKEAERMVKEAESELERLINQKKQSGKELSRVEIYRLSKKFYLDKLDYQVKLKGILGRKARIWDKKSESYVPDDQTKKPIEFKLMRSPKEETPLLKFIRESYETRIRNSLVKEGSEKDKTAKIEGKRDLREGAIRDLTEAWDEQEKTEEELKKYTEENLSERMKQKEDKWQEEINKATNSRGERLTEAEKRSLLQKFYLQELSSYEIKPEGGIKGILRGFFTGKEKVKILKEGKPVKINGKTVEFKVNWFLRHPGEDMIKFLRNQMEENLGKDLEKEFKKEIVKRTKEQAGGQQKTEDTPKETTENTTETYQKEEGHQELQKGEGAAEGEKSPEDSIRKEDYTEWLKTVGFAEAQKLAEASKKEEEYQEWLKSVGAAEAMKLAKAFEAYKTGKTKTQENIQETATEKAESEKRPLTQAEFFSRYLRANDLDEKDITPEKLQELQQNWKAYRKEMGIKSPKTQAPESKLSGKTAEIKTEKKDSTTLDGDRGVDAGQQQTEEEPQDKPGKAEQNKGTEKEWRGIDFKKMEAEGVFEKMKKMDVSKDSKKITEIIKRYILGIYLPDSLESLLKKYDQSRREEYKFGRIKTDLESLKNWIAFFLVEIRDQKKLEKLEEVNLETESKDKEPAVGEEPAVKEKKLRKKNKEEIVSEEKSPPGQGPEASSAPEIKESKEEDKLEWMERAIVLKENGSFNFKITPELKKFFKDRGYNPKQIREMSKDSKAAWDEASDIYQKEQKGIKE